MSVAHPFHRSPTAVTPSRRRAFPRRRPRPAGSGPAVAATSGSTTSVDTRSTAVRRGPLHEAVVPGTRTPAGVPRELVVDEAGKPRRAVLLAAIMIRRGRSVAEISAATGLPVDVVTCLSRSV